MPRPAPGYTLLELVVVLAVLGAVTALVAPAAIRGIDRWQARLAMDDVEQQFARLPVLARDLGISAELSDDVPWPARLPPVSVEGVELRFLSPLRLHSNGVCDGGRIRVLRGEARFDADVLPPFCRLEWSAP